MTRIKPLLLILPLTSLWLISGCIYRTPSDVRNLGQAYKYSFSASENYQSVYRKIIDQARSCYQEGMIGAQIVVQGDLYTDIKSGVITVAMHSASGVMTQIVIDINAVSDDQTNVIIHYLFGNRVEKRGQVIKDWVLDNRKDCKPKW